MGVDSLLLLTPLLLTTGGCPTPTPATRTFAAEDSPFPLRKIARCLGCFHPSPRLTSAGRTVSERSWAEIELGSLWPLAVIRLSLPSGLGSLPLGILGPKRRAAVC